MNKEVKIKEEKYIYLKVIIQNNTTINGLDNTNSNNNQSKLIQCLKKILKIIAPHI